MLVLRFLLLFLRVLLLLLLFLSLLLLLFLSLLLILLLFLSLLLILLLSLSLLLFLLVLVSCSCAGSLSPGGFFPLDPLWILGISSSTIACGAGPHWR